MNRDLQRVLAALTLAIAGCSGGAERAERAERGTADPAPAPVERSAPAAAIAPATPSRSAAKGDEASLGELWALADEDGLVTLDQLARWLTRRSGVNVLVEGSAARVRVPLGLLLAGPGSQVLGNVSSPRPGVIPRSPGPAASRGPTSSGARAPASPPAR